jgi:TPR repeat protein
MIAYEGSEKYIFVSYAPKKKPQQAFEWYTEAATEAHQRAQFELAECYRSGVGVKKNLKKAITWYSRVEEQGGDLADKAQTMLKILYCAAQ